MMSRQNGSGNNTNNNNGDEEDLDTFLTTMESKLRGPFSSLDLAKAVTTNALRGSHTPAQYLQNVSKVLSRTDKVIQSRVLIGLLGLEANDAATNQEIHHILRQAQQAPTHEEWVRTIAGLVEGIMFETPEAAVEAKSLGSEAGAAAAHRSCRGPEATKLLDQLCEEVCSNVQNAQEISNTDNPDAPPCPDLNASFIPYRYSLLPQNLLQGLVPECMDASQNPHFKVNSQASILQLDLELEAQRAKEELEHQGGAILMKTKMSGSTVDGSNAKAAAKVATALPPGFRPTKLVASSTAQKAAAAKAASSMFMPKKPNPLLVQRQKQAQQKTLLRRKGAAQSLVNKTKVKSRVPAAVLGPTTGATAAAAINSSTTNTAAAGAAPSASAPHVRATAGRFGRAAGAGGGGAAMAGRSKMKMIDVQEVSSLISKEQQAARDAAASETTATGRMSKKRRIMEAAAAAKKAKIATTATTTAANTTSNGTGAASAATSNGQPTTSRVPAHQPQMAPTNSAAAAAAAAASAGTSSSAPPPSSTSTKDEEWKVLLKERSNKLSEEDRQRVQQFFQHRYNPTPDQSLVKMKLHEQRTQDAATGQAVKETFYLELDYTNFSSKQSKKVKRY